MDYSFLIILALAFGAMWLMTSRTRKQQKEAANFRANLAPGQEVMTGSGLFATVVGVEDDVVILETSPGVTSRWLRPAIAKLVDPPVATDEAADDEDEDLYEDDDVLEEDELVEDERATTVETLEVPDDASSLTDRRDDEGTPRR
ncbi:preprotein translocase subunit YajC [Actinotalea ferrariae]|uniref:preprotein translocase subunit YajC n=1 Tax=Actinotalea ferrariae TaxID=1386098 RepID=UPI001C8B4C76|nr:preprotein translocase subunit YajC [Actinotalea ferrariae]MBX9246584.1 preprotein translocase subunit YajC [Actinotalea ferrariae]